MRIGQFGGDVKLEVLMVGNDSITKFDDQAARLFKGLNGNKEKVISIITHTFK